MRNSLIALLAIAAISSSPPCQDASRQPSLRMFIGDWRVTSLRADGGSSNWARTYSVAVRDSSVLVWIDRSSQETVVARGFLGRDPRTGLFYYISVFPSAPPASITGHPTSDGAIDWRVVPLPNSDHPFNRELVASRLTFTGNDRMDWIGERSAGWHFIFERVK